MKLSELIEQLQKLQQPTSNPDVILWRWECGYKLETVTLIEDQGVTVIELSGEVLE